MRGTLSGEQRLAIIEAKLGNFAQVSASAGDQGFGLFLDFDDEQNGQYDFYTFSIFRPEDQFAATICRETGEILCVAVFIKDEEPYIIVQQDSPEEEWENPANEVDNVLIQFMNAKIQELKE